MKDRHIVLLGDQPKAGLIARPSMADLIDIGFTYHFECLDAEGKLKWKDEFHNIVTIEGRNALLNTMFRGSPTQDTTWFIGLISSVSWSAVAAADTAAQINGTNAWKEANTGAGANTPTYTGSNRIAATFGSAASGGNLSTSAASAFAITGTGTVKGAFLATDQACAATTGTLFSAGLFSGGDRAVQNGDTLNVSLTLNTTSS